MLETPTPAQLRCLECGHEGPAGDAWDRVAHPPFGDVTQCPDCGSTNIHSLAP